MSSVMNARRTALEIKYLAKDSASREEDISKGIGLFILSFSYTDSASGQADDLQLTLEDSRGQWQASRKPRKGDTLKAALLTVNGEDDGKERRLECGAFQVDEISLSGPPDVLNLKAIAVPVASSLRGQKKDKAWEAVRLSVILEEIAAKGELKKYFACADDPLYSRVEQNQQSDLEFLQMLCEKAGLALKVTYSKIVIFDEEMYEGKPVLLTIKKRGSTVLNYSFSSNSRDCYSACKVSYYDAKTKATLAYEFKPPDSPDTGQVLVINEKVDSAAEAEKLAKKLLRQKNKEENKASLTLAGDVRLVSGKTVMLEGWGRYDGKYIIEQAKHDNGSSGYQVSVELRKILEGY
jgi:phage protein D